MGKHIQLICYNCDPRHYKPGSVVRTLKVQGSWTCYHCGRILNMDNTDHLREKQIRWDKYFHKVCKAIASKSPCLSRQIGAILVRDKSIVSTGYNGPARGYPHCRPIRVIMPEVSTETETHWQKACPRHVQGFKSGEGLHLCPAAHAEGNCIANAARNGVVTVDTTLYMNAPIPCKDCSIILVNAGIVEVVVDELIWYHEISKIILANGNIKVRKFRL